MRVDNKFFSKTDENLRAKDLAGAPEKSSWKEVL